MKTFSFGDKVKFLDGYENYSQKETWSKGVVKKIVVEIETPEGNIVTKNIEEVKRGW